MNVDRELGWLLVLWAWSNRSTSRAPSSAPRKPPQLQPSQLKIPGVDVYAEPSEVQLSNPPQGTGQTPDDLLWARYAQEGDGPPLTAEELAPSSPVSRKLTGFERWALEPYFPQMSYLLETVVHNGKKPAELQPPPNMWALTDYNREIWILHQPRPLWSRWWLSMLAHELSHVVQMKMGMTREELIKAWREHGYENSPIEVQARAVQRRVLRGLTLRARSFFRAREGSQ